MNRNMILAFGLVAICTNFGKHPTGGGFNKVDKKKLVKDLKRYNKAYRDGKPLITDQEYDALIEQLRMIDPDNAWLKQVESETIFGNGVHHDPPMLSIRKIYKVSDLQKWLSAVHKAGRQVNNSSPEIIITPKLDGIAGDWSLHRNMRGTKDQILSTRGDGKSGNNITKMVDYGLRFEPPETRDEEARGEIVVSLKYFNDKIRKTPSDHPRNFVAGISNSISSGNVPKDKGLKALSDGGVRFVSFSGFSDDQKRVFRLNSIDMKHIVNNIEEVFSELTESVDYLCDGIVFKVVDERIQEIMGATNSHNRWMVAFKINGEAKKTTVKKVNWEMGRLGELTPVLEIEPTYVGGATMTKVSGHNWRTYMDQQLGVGAVVKIVRAGEIIPYVSTVVKKSKSTPYPERCPKCNHKLTTTSSSLVCSNKTECPGIITSTLEHFFDKNHANIKGFGPKTLRTIVDYGISRGEFYKVSDILGMTANDFKRMGFGEKRAQNLETAIQQSFKRGIDANVFLAGFGISDLGRSSSERILKQFKKDSAKETILGLEKVKVQDLRKIDGIGAKTSESIHKGIKEAWPQIKRVMDYNFNLNEMEPNSNASGDVITVMFTGVMDYGSRKDIQGFAKANGFNVATSLSKAVDILVLGQSAGKSKLKKAEKLNTKMISEREFFKMVEKS